MRGTAGLQRGLAIPSGRAVVLRTEPRPASLGPSWASIPIAGAARGSWARQVQATEGGLRPRSDSRPHYTQPASPWSNQLNPHSRAFGASQRHRLSPSSDHRLPRATIRRQRTDGAACRIAFLPAVCSQPRAARSQSCLCCPWTRQTRPAAFRTSSFRTIGAGLSPVDFDPYREAVVHLALQDSLSAQRFGFSSVFVDKAKTQDSRNAGFMPFKQPIYSIKSIR